MIDYEYALRKAQERMERMDVPVDVIWQEEFCDGWVFVYQSRRYIESGDLEHCLVGNGPIVVDKHSGEVAILGTYAPIAQMLTDYVRRKEASVAAGGDKCATSGSASV
jgi:hypothetical protein